MEPTERVLPMEHVTVAQLLDDFPVFVVAPGDAWRPPKVAITPVRPTPPAR